jgi:WD40 repeat protein
VNIAGLLVSFDLPFAHAPGDEAGGLRVWDLELGDCTCVLAGHSGAVNALSIAASGGVVVSASADGTCRVWDLQQGGACRCALVGHTGGVKVCFAVCHAALIRSKFVLFWARAWL